MARDGVDIRLRLQEARKFQSDAKRSGRAVDDLGDRARRAGRKASESGRGFSVLGVRMRGLGGISAGVGATFRHSAGAALAAAGGFLAIGAGIRTAATEYSESARVGAQTNAVLRSTGRAANVTAKQVGDLAQAISNKVGIDDEAIQSAENLLLTFTDVRNETGRGNDVFNQATRVITDMSVALGTDMRGSAIQVGKALNDPIKGVTALRRVGVSFTADQLKQIKTLQESGNRLGAQRLILRELNREFRGSAAAQAQPIDRLKVGFLNLAESIGGLAAPIVNKGLTRVANFVTGLQSGKGAGGAVAARIKSVAAAAKTVGQGAFAGITGKLAPGGQLGTIGLKVGKVMRTIGQGAIRAGRQLLAAFRPAVPFFRNVLLPLGKGIAIGIGATLVAAFKIAVPIIRVVARVLGFLGRKAAPLRPLIQGIGVVIGTFLPGLALRGIAVIQKGERAFVNLARGAARAALWVRNAIGDVLRWLGGLAGRFGANALKIGNAIKNGIVGAFRGAVGIASSIGSTIRTWLNNNTPFGDEVKVGPVHFRLPALARGTSNFAGGMALVGEQGPELVHLPRGSRVTPNHALGPALAAATPVIEVVIQPQPVYFDGRLVTEVVAKHTATRRARR
jgi:hypothetical protein